MNSDSILDQYPFLLDLPEPIRNELDLQMLLIPSHEQKEKIRGLEEKTNSFIVLYKKDYEPRGKHLCKTIRSAELESDQLKSISQFELEIQKETDLIVVAYHKPVLFF
ncbi:hypothetical protein [Leptospira stimsonii]|uniref:Uncharacterized protein n=1 Tax=Leptospira stimsonii TaxID=2202203 RepID=A0A396ZEK9_9LEPT|nr:hypothetical protein [Leptospira stimsonii]RHX92955.1 hypothetical protein DLM75_07295 [Leptospira stimsonii]